MVSPYPAVARLQHVSNYVQSCEICADISASAGIYYDAPTARVPGGSEDVLLDLAVRQLVKSYQKAADIIQRPKGSPKL